MIVFLIALDLVYCAVCLGLGLGWLTWKIFMDD
jgi:hypothetical protein